MSYPGICDTYGKGPTMVTAYSAPAVTSSLANFALYQSFEGAQVAFAGGFMAGVIGFGAGFLAHFISDAELKRNHVGMTRGARLTRRRQFVAYAVPAVFLTYNAASVDYKALETPPQEFPVEDVAKATPADNSTQTTQHRRIVPPRPRML